VSFSEEVMGTQNNREEEEEKKKLSSVEAPEPSLSLSTSSLPASLFPVVAQEQGQVVPSSLEEPNANANTIKEVSTSGWGGSMNNSRRKSLLPLLGQQDQDSATSLQKDIERARERHLIAAGNAEKKAREMDEEKKKKEREAMEKIKEQEQARKEEIARQEEKAKELETKRIEQAEAARIAAAAAALAATEAAAALLQQQKEKELEEERARQERKARRLEEEREWQDALQARLVAEAQARATDDEVAKEANRQQNLLQAQRDREEAVALRAEMAATKADEMENKPKASTRGEPVSSWEQVLLEES